MHKDSVRAAQRKKWLSNRRTNQCVLCREVMAVHGKKIRKVYEVHTEYGQNEFCSAKCGGY